MKFLCDQNVERRVSDWLTSEGHDVTIGVVDYDGRMLDPAVLALARDEHRVLITNDKGFGELIWRLRLAHAGVILFRMRAASADEKIERLKLVLNEHAHELGRFIVVTATRIRVRRPPEQ